MSGIRLYSLKNISYCRYKLRSLRPLGATLPILTSAETMPQSMLAFLAMSIVMMITLSQLRTEKRSNAAIVENEYEIMANALAIEQMEIVAASTVWDDLDVWDDSLLTKIFDFSTFQESFDIGVSVQFVDEFGNPSIVPTTIKEVAITAMHERYELPLVTHARLISE